MATTSSGTITTTTVNGVSRITGLSSGIDVDSIVESLMTAEKTKLHKLKQAQQLAEWRQEAYQEFTNTITTFSNTYFSLTSATSLIRTSTYMQYTATSDSSAVTVTTDSTAAAGNHTVGVSSLATAAMREGGVLGIRGSVAVNYTAAQGSSLTLKLGDASYTLDLDSTVTDVSSLQTALDTAVGAGKLTVSEESGILSVSPADDSGIYSITLSGPAGALSALGLGDGSETSVSNVLDTASTLAELAGSMAAPFTFNADGQVVFTLNGTAFTFDQDETLAEMISEINAGDAGVTMKYNSLTNKLILTADTPGSGTTISAGEQDSTFLSTLLGTVKAGTDAKVTVDGTTLTLNSNELKMDGVTYTFHKLTTEDALVTITRDTDSIYEAITGFVDAYNALIENINKALAEDYDYDYAPLTDDQKNEMSDEEIEKWEAKAKTGLLEHDYILQNMLTNLRAAVTDAVSGAGLTLKEIGIAASSDYTEHGKLDVDETTLQSAIESDPDGVMQLFARKSTSYSNSSVVRDLNARARGVRYQEEGIAYRFYDILQDNIATDLNSAGNQGLLIEKAGSSATTYDNTLTELIEEYQDKIDVEEDRLDAKETYYYEKYTNMETYLNNLSSQYSALTSMLDSSS
ncbi:MAG: flagellar filament capping protein FliD [Bacillota bacterium]